MVRFELYDGRQVPLYFQPLYIITSTNKKEITHVNRTCH
jgi:hypothetical protein